MGRLSFRTIKKESRKLISCNFLTIILFLISYTIFSFMLVGSFSYLLFYFSLKFAGISYLSTSNLIVLLENPLSMACIVLIVFVLSFVTYFEINGLIIAFDYSKRDMKIGYGKLIYLSLSTTTHLSSLKNFFAIVYILLMLPFVGLLSISNIGYSLSIPGFIMDVIKANRLFLLGFSVIFIIVTLISLTNIFSMHETVIHGKDWKEASAVSRKLIRKKYFRTVFYILRQSMFIDFMTLLIGFLLMFICFVGCDLILGIPIADNARGMSIFTSISQLILMFLSPLINVSVISVLYYHYQEETDEERAYESYRLNRKNWTMIAAVVATAILVSFITSQYDDDMLNVMTDRPEIAAHRGESETAPENSMPAFLLALEDENVDWIELDVHQTKDNVLVVTHDDSLNRIAGISKKVYQVSYDELSRMDVGSWFSEEYSGLRVATLAEVLDVCKNRIKIQIEIKPTPYDRNIEKEVIDLIKEKQMEDQCYVISLNADTLKNVKEIDESIKTVYVMAVSMGDVEDIEFADNFSIEESFISEDLVRRIHALGKDCFVWTINTIDNVQYLVDCNIDVILTDNPKLIADKLDTCDYLNGLAKTLRKYLN